MLEENETNFSWSFFGSLICEKRMILTVCEIHPPSKAVHASLCTGGVCLEEFLFS